MTYAAVKRVVIAATVAGAIAVLATESLVLPGTRRLYSPSLAAAVAAGLLGLTVLLQATFLIVQLLPNGRRIVPITRDGADGWFAMIACTVLPAVSWEQLGTIAGPPVTAFTYGIPAPLVLVLALCMLAARLVRLRREYARGR